jgi:hypothetical protein
MKEHPYKFYKNQTEFRYDFTSISDKKEVQKIVVLTSSQFKNVFNLALLDVLDSGSVSDSIDTRNGDMREVMATVISIIDDFLTDYPDKWIMFKGSDDRRHRLYRVIIAREIEFIRKRFDVFGQSNSGILEVFELNKDYTIYFITKITNEK